MEAEMSCPRNRTCGWAENFACWATCALVFTCWNFLAATALRVFPRADMSRCLRDRHDERTREDIVVIQAQRWCSLDVWTFCQTWRLKERVLLSPRWCNAYFSCFFHPKTPMPNHAPFFLAVKGSVWHFND